MLKSLHASNRLRQLRAFCLTAENNSVSLAAAELQISQPSVSLLIKSLEEDLRVSLFDRRGPRIDLTPQGTTLLEIAAPLVKDMDSVEELFLQRMGKLNAGTIHIATGQTTALYVLPKYLKAFHNHYENVEINLHNVDRRKVFTQLREGDIDLMVSSMMKLPDDMIYTPLLSYRPMLITSKDHPLASENRISLKKLGRYKMVLPHRDSMTRQMIETIYKEQSMPLKICLEVNGWEVVKKYVAQGMGISILSEVCLTGEEELAEIAIDDYFPARSYGIITSQEKVLKPQARKFIEIMDRHFFTHDNIHR